jgi:RNA polymerase sigma-70 factor (ECF subfamily)
MDHAVAKQITAVAVGAPLVAVRAAAALAARSSAAAPAGGLATRDTEDSAGRDEDRQGDGLEASSVHAGGIVDEAAQKNDPSRKEFLSQFRAIVHSGGLDPASKTRTPALRVVPAPPPGEEPLTFEQIYRRYSRYVAAVVLRLDPGAPDLDDVVQDVFLAAAGGLRRLRDPGATKAWLATVAVRMVRRRLRLRRMWRWLGIGDDTPPAALVDAGSNPVDRLLLASVYQVLGGLAVDDRVAFVLHCIEGETLEDVARIARCSLATAKRRIARAQRAIDELVGDDGGGRER